MAHHFLNKVESHVNNAAKAVGIANTAWQTGKTLWAGAQALAPTRRCYL
jgi:hypothetical protein